jgi:hypothetical protein
MPTKIVGSKIHIMNNDRYYNLIIRMITKFFICMLIILVSPRLQVIKFKESLSFKSDIMLIQMSLQCYVVLLSTSKTEPGQTELTEIDSTRLEDF